MTALLAPRCTHNRDAETVEAFQNQDPKKLNRTPRKLQVVSFGSYGVLNHSTFNSYDSLASSR